MSIMQTITAPVGETGKNSISDVALVQAILLKTQRAATATAPASPYLSSYDGLCGDKTKAAIRAFQLDFGLQDPANPNVTAGSVKPGDATWSKLLATVGGDFSDMRVLPGGKTVYLAATSAQLQATIAAANALTFTPAFRAKVIACIARMHALYGIAIGVCPKGDRRSFQTQYELLTGGGGVTKAGPGESNHNFGMAVDLGFQGLRWLSVDGAVTDKEDPWLHKLDAGQSDQSLRFWDALRAVGTSAEVAAFRGPVSDRPHLQNWDDAGVSMAARLADLLTRSGTMRWSGTRGSYACDIGLGDSLIPIGTAAQIWNRQANVTAALLTRARADSAPRPAVRSEARVTPGAPGQAGTAAPATQVDVITMQRELRQQFDLADQHWGDWTAG
jgi:hypothetical protein